MSVDWLHVALGSVVSLFTGFPFKSKDYSSENTGYKLLRGDNIAQGRLRWEDVKRWAESNLINKHKGYWLEDGDVVLAMDRPWIEAGLKYAQIAPKDLPCLLVQRVACLRASELLEQNFLRYLIASRSFVEYVKQVQTGTAVPHISGKQILAFEFYLPPKETQLQISKILKALDNKIQLNHQINQTLEQMAQAIFKSWFVDFEPVKAKIEARKRWRALQPGNESASPVCYAEQPEPLPDLDSYMNLAAMQAISGKSPEQLAHMEREQPEQYAQLRTTAELFPAAMQPSELGDIPEGWDALPLSKMVELIGGGTPKKSEPSFWNGDICWFSVKDAPSEGNVFVVDTEEKITQKGLERSSTKLLPLGATIITARGTVGKLALTGVVSAMNQSCYGVVGNEGTGPYLNYLCLHKAVETLKQNTHGAVFDTITRSTFETVIQPRSCLELRQRFEHVVHPLFQEIKNNLLQSNTLCRIRDSLLPKLLSGELTVPEAEATVAETLEPMQEVG